MFPGENQRAKGPDSSPREGNRGTEGKDQTERHDYRGNETGPWKNG